MTLTLFPKRRYWRNRVRERQREINYSLFTRERRQNYCCPRYVYRMISKARNRTKTRSDPGTLGDMAKAEKCWLISTGERDVSGELYGSIGPASLCGTRLQLRFKIVAPEQNKVSDICSINQIRTCCSIEFCLFLKSPARSPVRNINFLANCKTSLVETTEERLMC